MRGFTLFEVLVYLALFSFMLNGLFISVAYLHDATELSRKKAADLVQMLNDRDAQDYGAHEI